jgi:ketosteroid isomerase-like protein
MAAIFHAEGITLATGKPFNSEILRLYTFKDGKIIRIRNFYDTASYVEAVSK